MRRCDPTTTSSVAGGGAIQSATRMGRRSLSHVQRWVTSFFIERRPDGDYAIRKPNSGRASAVAPTQAEAIARARRMNSDATLHVERVRNTDVGSRDKWRKLVSGGSLW
ncbi:MAG: DUF2188 domain-containing protein [Candidatus Dormibacteria bacterium]